MKPLSSSVVLWLCVAVMGAALLTVGSAPAFAAGCSCRGGGAAAGVADATAVKKTDAVLVKEQKPIYPLATCVVTGEKLGGDMGDPIDYVHQDRLVRFCCKGCIAKFKADPAKYLKTLDAAVVKAQAPKYPLDTCVVMGGKLGDMGSPVEYVYQGRLVRFCCKGCIKKFEAAPASYLKQLDAKAKPAGAAPTVSSSAHQH